jgi:putative ABC transport system substrate-binding protein
MRRREFITLLGGAAVLCPFVARAQQPAIPVVGYLYSGTPDITSTIVAAFLRGLREAGFSEGRNLAVEYRWANNEPEKLPELAADLVRRRVAVIVVPGTATGVLAAKAATSAIPIVFRTGGDPVELGLVASLNRPGGNVTGIGAMSLETVTKRLDLLRELVPAAARFAVLFNPNDPNAEQYRKELQAAALAMGRQIEFFGATTSTEIDVAFATLIQKRCDALLVVSQGLFINRYVQIVTQAARHAVPAVYPNREFCAVGGVMSYGASATDQFHQTGIYAGRILKGEKPAEMPILRANKFELVVNLQTAKILGIKIPTSLLTAADEVIE